MNNIQKRILYSVIACLILGSVLLSAFSFGDFTFFNFDRNFASKKYTIEITEKVYIVRVCGAVKRSGNYTFKFGDTYGDVLLRAGILDVTYFENLNAVIPADTTEILCCFLDAGEQKYPTNINSSLFKFLYQESGIETEIAQKIINYVDLVGTIERKEQLLEDSVLTQDEWNKTFYRIFVGEKS